MFAHWPIKYEIRLVLDCSLLGENAYLVLQREEEFKNSNMETVIKTMTGLADLCYFSARNSALRVVAVFAPTAWKFSKSWKHLCLCTKAF